MFGSTMLNKRPNMNVFNKVAAGRDIQDDDDYEDPGLSSFTKSKVDDDDDKFKNRSESEFLDFLARKKPKEQTPARNDKNTPFTTPPSQKDVTPSIRLDTPSVPSIAAKTPQSGIDSPPKQPQVQPTTPQTQISPKKQQERTKTEPPNTPQNQPETPSKPVQPTSTKPTPQKPTPQKPTIDTPVQSKPTTPKPSDLRPPITPAKEQPKQPEPKPSPNPKPSSNTKQPEPKPSPKPADPKIIEPKPSPKPADPTIIEPKPSPKPQDPKPIEPKPSPKPTEPKVVEPKPSPKPAEPKVTEPKPSPKPAEPKQVEPKPSPAPSPAPAPKPVEPKPKPTDPRPSPKPVPADPRPSPKPETKPSLEPKTKTEPTVRKETDAQKIEIAREPQSYTPREVDPRDKIGSLIRPQFIRKGKAAPALKTEIDRRIRAIEPRNPKDVSREYVVRSHPSYYGSTGQFDDIMYPNNLSQIYQLPNSVKNKKQISITFERLDKVYNQSDAINVVDPNDITPGEFETYNLMSAMACVAEKPQLICRLIEDQRVNKDGYYYVRLCVDGVWRYVLVDDWLPFREKQAMHAGPSQDARVKKLSKQVPSSKTELWVSLLEKAVSKIFGSYEDIEKNVGSIKDDLYLLTGAPTYEYQLDKFNEADLHKHLSNLHPEAMVVFSLRASATKLSLFKEKLNKSPLFGYSLLAYDQSKKQLRVRNPWGWYQDPSRMSGSVKAVGDEGEFTISVSDIVKYFDTASVANFHDDYWSISFGVRQLPNIFSAYTITLASDTQFYLTYSQLDRRYFRNNLKEKYNYSFARLLVLDQDRNLIISNQGAAKDISVKVNAAAGQYHIHTIFRYTVIICIDWNNYWSESFCPLDSTLSYYGSNDCVFKRVPYQPNTFASLLGPKVQASGELRNFSPKDPSFNKQVQEWVWFDEDLRLVAITWGNPQAIVYKRDFKTVQRQKLTPLCFFNAAEVEATQRLTSTQLVEKRRASWLEASELQFNGNYTVLFKPTDPNVACNRAFLKDVGLV